MENYETGTVAQEQNAPVQAPEENKKQSKGRLALKITALVLGIALLAVSFLLYFAARWYIKVYGNIGFDSILFTLQTMGGVQPSLVGKFIAWAVVPAVLWAAGVSLVLFLRPKKHLKIRSITIFPLPRWLSRTIAAVLSVALLLSAAFVSGLVNYIKNIFSESEIFETEYVDPNSVEVTFPEEKRNLIYIYLESMEVTYLSKEQGGAEPENLIPELYELAENNINFSHNSGVGGFQSTSGTTWTIGALVGQTSGVPLKCPTDVDDWQNGYGKDGVFLPGLTSLSDILHENGYYQTLMVGSDAAFGGRKTYYETHGTDHIYDLYTARTDDIIEDDYFVWWGFEDKYLFEYAKQELLEVSQKDQPFAFSMLTVDTHHVSGYMCELCGTEHDEQYENVISCSSRQVAQFVEWIQQQDFYENTTIIIAGDHPSMDRAYFHENIPDSYTRRMYNCFINTPMDTDYSKNRTFTTLDMFPTTLAAIGCQIEGNRLGLGTDLFSGVPTLAEVMGYQDFNAQISMASQYYATVFRQEEATE